MLYTQNIYLNMTQNLSQNGMTARTLDVNHHFQKIKRIQVNLKVLEFLRKFKNIVRSLLIKVYHAATGASTVMLLQT